MYSFIIFLFIQPEYEHVNKLNKFAGQEHELHHSVEKQMIESYEDAFSMIKEITGEDDLENIVNNFIQQEDENFALFNYVNELNDETEQLQEEVNTIKKNIVTFREDNSKLDEERKEFLKELEVRMVGLKRLCTGDFRPKICHSLS